MDAIIGKYRVRMEDTRLILTHAAGISFDLTDQEALALLNFIKVYQQSLEQEPDTETHLPSIYVHSEEHTVQEM